MKKCLIFSEVEEWEETKKCLETYLGAKDGKVSNFKIFKKIRSVKKAKLLSYLFPGLGQIYAGSVLGGIGSFLLQAGAVSFTALSFYHGFYFSGYLTGIPICLSLFFGDKKNAVYLINKRNARIKNERKEYVKNLILSP